MNVITIRCIANESKGFGNLSRAILLAKELKKNSNKIIFLIDKNLNAKKILQSNNLKYFFVPQFTSKKKESEFIIKKMNSVKSKSVILEMREFSEILSKYLKNYGKQVIIIDDGSNDGTISVIPSGGAIGPDMTTFAWNSPVITSPSSTSIASLFADTYVCEVADMNGCLYSDNITLNEPTLITLTETSTSTTCNGDLDGTATVTATSI